MKGWLLDTNVIAALINPAGASSVKRWAAAQDEALFNINILTIALEANLCLVTRNIRDVADSGATLLNPWSVP